MDMATSKRGVPVYNPFDPLDFQYDLSDRSSKKSRSNFTFKNQEPNAGKYVLISHATPEQDLSKASVFLIQKGLELISKGFLKANRLRNGTILLLTKDNKQTAKFLDAKTLGDQIPIAVTLHPYLNYSKGVIFSHDLLNEDEDTIKQELKTQKVIEAKRIKKFVRNIDGDKIVDTPLVVLTFDCPEIPKTIKAGYLNLQVRLHIPTPMRCQNCQTFGHTKKRCRRSQVCKKCCSNDIDHFKENVCNNAMKCANCGDGHESFRKSCPVYKDEFEICKIRSVEKISYVEAKKKIRQLCPRPKPLTIPYSEVIISQHNKTNKKETTISSNQLNTNTNTEKPTIMQTNEPQIQKPTAHNNLNTTINTITHTTKSSNNQQNHQKLQSNVTDNNTTTQLEYNNSTIDPTEFNNITHALSTSREILYGNYMKQ